MVFRTPSDDEADDDELEDIIKGRQQRAARAKGSVVPPLLDQKKILDFIDLWHKDPNAPMPDLGITLRQSHMVTTFIAEDKWKYDQARTVKKFNEDSAATVAAAEASSSNKAMPKKPVDPKKILEFIDLWHKYPNAPMPELGLTPG